MSGSGGKTISALVERQMRNWEIGRQQAPTVPEPEGEPFKPFVTISRMAGSGGAAVAQGLADKVGWPLFDREVLQYMAGDDAVRQRLYETLDERDIGFIEETVRTFASAEFKRHDYFHRLTETILAIAHQGNAVFLGRGADLILPRHLGVRVRIVALAAARAQRYAKDHDIDTVQAARELERLQQQRAEFVRNHFNVDPDAQDRCDLALNLTSITVDEAVHLIAEVMRLRGMIE